MYLRCSGRAAIQRRVRRGQTSPLKPLRSSTSAAYALFLLVLYANLKARTTRANRAHLLRNWSGWASQTSHSVRYIIPAYVLLKEHAAVSEQEADRVLSRAPGALQMPESGTLWSNNQTSTGKIRKNVLRHQSHAAVEGDS